MTGEPSDSRTAVLFVAMQTGNLANGGIVSLGEVVASLKRFRSVMLTNLETAVTKSWRELGIAVEVVPEDASLGLRHAPIRTLASYCRYFHAVRQLMKAHAIKVVHANDPLAFQLALPAVRTMRGAAIVLNLRDTLDPERTAPRRKFRWLFDRADHTLFLSRDMIDRWQATVPAVARKASHTYSIVDFSKHRFAPLPKSRNPKILVSGVLCPKKGQLFFLQEIAPFLVEQNITCLLAGDESPGYSDYAARCRAAATELGPQVQILGYRPDVAELTRQSRVVCVTSRYEGLMRTMIEAMAAGRPVVSTDVASAREVLRIPGEEAGYVFHRANAPEMAQAIVQLCREDSPAVSMGANGYAVARRLFDRSAVVAAYEDCYERLVCRGQAQIAP